MESDLCPLWAKDCPFLPRANGQLGSMDSKAIPLQVPSPKKNKNK